MFTETFILEDVYHYREMFVEKSVIHNTEF